MPKITELFAYVADEGGGDEGIIAKKMGRDWLPLIGADLERMKSLRESAQEISDVTGMAVTLKKFSEVTELETLTPQEKDDDG